MAKVVGRKVPFMMASRLDYEKVRDVQYRSAVLAMQPKPTYLDPDCSALQECIQICGPAPANRNAMSFGPGVLMQVKTV